MKYSIFPQLFSLFVWGFVSTKSLEVPKTVVPTQNIYSALKNKYFLAEESYNDLIRKIEHHDISEIAFTNKMDSVISENVDKTGNVLMDYSITKINPFVIEKITDEAVQNNVKTIFQQSVTDNGISALAGELLGFVGNFIIPVMFVVYAISMFRASRGGGGGFGSGLPGVPSLKKTVNEDKFLLQKTNISLNSFAGSEEIMMECTEVVSYLKNATVYQAAGAEIPRGVLLEGPPGTGKTLLAKAIASEANANFISIAASEFVELFVGMGASKIRSLFQNARSNKPCIVFIDEIDAVGRQRGAGINMANDEREQTLNQLLAEMDGFADNEGILIMGATNRKDVLDAALLRPGRFDRVLTVPYPDRESRKSILKVHSKNKQLGDDINLDLVAELTGGFSGAQLKNLLNEAAIYAAREGKVIISNTHLYNALDKLIVGLVKQRDNRSDESKRRVAIHEIGHALLAASFAEYFDLKKVTIQSTYNGAGGYTIFNEYQNITDSGLYTKDLLNKRLIVTMGGKAAESVVYGDEFVSLGAIQDLKQANSLAQRMIGNYGMGKKLEVFYNENVDDGRNPFLGRSMAMGNTYSEKIKDMMDRETLNLVIAAYQQAKTILTEKREIVDIMVEKLLTNITLSGNEIADLLRKT